MNRYTLCTEMFEDWTPEQTFAKSAELGYGAVEIAPFTLAPLATDVTPRRRAELRRAAETAGVRVAGLHWLLAKTTGFHLTTADREVRSATARYLGDLARLCADLGGEVLVFGSPGQRSVEEGVAPEKAFDNARAVLAEAAPVFEAAGVCLCFEPLARRETNFINTGDEGSRLCDAVDHLCVKLHLDVKAMSDEDAPLPDIIRANARHLRHFHVNDPNLLGPGMGEVTFEPIRDALAEVGYAGYLSVEVFDYSPGAERIARESMDYLRRVFG